jgi:hypothetical protein
MEHSTGGYNKATKTGKRISLDDLFAFLKKNKQVFKDVGCVDLNDTKDTTVYTSLEKLNFQDFRKVNYLPKNLANIFKLHSADFGKYIHAGTLKTINLKRQDVANLQISLYSSIMTCLKQSFLSLPVSTQVDFISKLIDRLQNESKGSKYEEFCYARKYRWKKSDISNDITHSLSGGNIIKYLSDYFHINIFVLDVDKDELYFGSDEYVPYKKSIFLLKYADETFEPFFTEQTKTFSITDKIMDRIRSKSKDVNVYILCDNMDFKFQEVEEDLDWYSQKPGFNKRDFLAQKQKTRENAKNEESGNESVDSGVSLKSDNGKKKTTNSNKKHTDDNYDESMNNFDDGYDYGAEANEMDVKSDDLGDMWKLTNLSEDSGSDEFIEKTKSKTLKNKTIRLSSSSESESSDESIKPAKKKQPVVELNTSSSKSKPKSKKAQTKSESEEDSSNSEVSSPSPKNTKKVSNKSSDVTESESSDESSSESSSESSDESSNNGKTHKSVPPKSSSKVLPKKSLKNTKKPSSKSSSDNSSKKPLTKAKKYKASDIKATLKLDELQTIAKSLKINTIDNKSKKNKTKAILMKEIKSKLDE